MAVVVHTARQARGEGEDETPAHAPGTTDAARVIVLVEGHAAGTRAMRLAKELAGADGTWIVVHVGRSGRPSPHAPTPGALKLAETLGAQTAAVGRISAQEALAYAREQGATCIVVANAHRGLKALAPRPKLASRLLALGRSSGIDVIAVADDEVARGARRKKSADRHGPLRWRAYAEAAAATAACVGIAWLLDPLLETANLALVFLVGVLVAAARGGVGPGLFANMLSFLAFNFFLTEPRFTLFVSGTHDSLTLVFFFAVALVTGQLAARVRNQLETIRASHRRTASLESFSRRLTGIVGQEDFAQLIVDHARSALGFDAIVLLPDVQSRLVAVADSTNGDVTADERAAAEHAFLRREPAGRGTETLPASPWFFVPLYGRDTLGVLGVRAADGGSAFDTERRALLFAMRDQASTALDRVQLATAMGRNRLVLEADKLRTALLSSVSHDLRTPLVSIKGAASALLDLDASLTAADKHELLKNVLEETERLNRYVQNLLDMTRLGYGAVKPRKDWRDVREILGSARRALKLVLADRVVHVGVPERDAFVHTDSALLEQILVNLLENAAKYSAPGAPIEVTGTRRADEFELSVCDRGPGIPPADRERVFDLFSRARAADQQKAGTGMGLSICRGFAEALGGNLRVGDTPRGGGACFVLRLPQPRRPESLGAET